MISDRVRDYRLRMRYGITLAEYETRFREQRGGCAICGHPPKTRRLAVDHEHKTGRVRGLLCMRCNKYIVGPHTIETAQRLLAYLQQANGWSIDHESWSAPMEPE